MTVRFGIGTYTAGKKKNVKLIPLNVTQDGCTDVTSYERNERRKHMTFLSIQQPIQ